MNITTVRGLILFVFLGAAGNLSAACGWRWTGTQYAFDSSTCITEVGSAPGTSHSVMQASYNGGNVVAANPSVAWRHTPPAPQAPATTSKDKRKPRLFTDLRDAREFIGDAAVAIVDVRACDPNTEPWTDYMAWWSYAGYGYGRYGYYGSSGPKFSHPVPARGMVPAIREELESNLSSGFKFRLVDNPPDASFGMLVCWNTVDEQSKSSSWIIAKGSESRKVTARLYGKIYDRQGFLRLKLTGEAQHEFTEASYLSLFIYNKEEEGHVSALPLADKLVRALLRIQTETEKLVASEKNETRAAIDSVGDLKELKELRKQKREALKKRQELERELARR